MSWTDTTLSTTTTLATHEDEINDITTAANVSNKITLAKSLIKGDIEIKLRQNHYSVDYENDEELINILANPETFTNACDYLTLSLIYKDLSKGNQDSLYYDKYLMYKNDYANEYAKASTRIDIDYDQDGTTNRYQQNIQTYKVCKR